MSNKLSRRNFLVGTTAVGGMMLGMGQAQAQTTNGKIPSK